MNSKEHQLGFYFREQSTTPENKLWVSPDLVLAEDLFVPAGGKATANLLFTPEIISQFSQFTLEEIRNLRASPRSRVRQVFSEFEDLPEDIYKFCLENGIERFVEGDSKGLVVPVTVVNFGLRPNKFSAGGFGRLYRPGGKQLAGDELVKSNVQIDGKELETSVLRMNNQGLPVAIRLSLDQSTRMWIPPSREPVPLDLTSVHNREQIKDVLRPVPETGEVIPYLVYSAERLTMPDGIYGLVSSYAVAGTNGRETLRSMSVHGTSQLLDPGRDWPIIFELRGRTTPEECANYIDIYLFSAR